MILIAGGLGYLGGRIEHDFQAKGIKTKISTSRANFTDVTSSKKIFKLDFSRALDQALLSKELDGVDAIIYLPSLNHFECSSNPQLAKQIKVTGAKELMRFSIDKGIKTFINISTSQVYGDKLSGLLDESSSINPENRYAEFHANAEFELDKLAQKEDISLITLRLTNGIGSPLNKEANCWSLLFNDLCKKVITDNKIELNSSRYIRKDFVPISYICNVLSFLINEIKLPGTYTFNLSSAKTLKLHEVVELIYRRSKETLSLEPKIKFLNSNLIDDEDNFLVSNELLKKTGVEANLTIEKEVDDLLLNCFKWYS